MTMMIAETAFSDAAKAQLLEIERLLMERMEAAREEPKAVIREYLDHLAKILVSELIVKALIAGIEKSKPPFWAKKWRGQR